MYRHCLHRRPKLWWCDVVCAILERKVFKSQWQVIDKIEEMPSSQDEKT